MAFIDLDKEQIDTAVKYLEHSANQCETNGEHLNAHRIRGIINELNEAVPDYIAFDAEEMMAQDAMR